MEKESAVVYIKTISLLIVSFVSLIFPVFFLTSTTDFFVFPKQVLIVFATIILLILWAVRVIVERKISFRSNPFTVPAALFAIIVIASSVISPNMYDSLVQSVPVLFLVFFFFLAINAIEDKKGFNVALTALTLGAVLSCILSILYYAKIYILPFPAIQSQYMSTFGSPVQHLTYLLPILILAAFYLFRRDRLTKINSSNIIQLISSIIIVLGMLLIVFEVLRSAQKPLLLPYIHGFQIALASISQDGTRLLRGLLLGSGYGTFSVDFTRFKLPSFNSNADLWNLTFSYSSSYFLELIATTGILGAAAYLYLIVKTVKTRIPTLNPLYIALMVTFGLSFVIPFSFSMLFLMFDLLAFYTAYLYLEKDRRVVDVNLVLFASRNEMFSFTEQAYGSRERDVNSSLSLFLPVLLVVIMIPVVAFTGYYAVQYFMSDMNFAASLQRDALNNGQKAYDLERTAIAEYPYKSDYYVVFSQINYALANSIANNVPKNSSPSAQVQQTILGLLQQSINSARGAVTLSPLSSGTWQNLSQIYRNLINVGQNADQFAFASINQAVALDPSNPQLYILRGGMYYQLGQYDAAISDFTTAKNLKPDFANAYYNLGHAYEQKGDFQDALTAYQIVAQLVASNKDSLNKINGEISALQTKIGQAQKQAQNTNQAPQNANTTNQPPLEVSNPSQNAIQNPGSNVKLPPPPSGRPTPSTTPAPTKEATTPTPAQ